MMMMKASFTKSPILDWPTDINQYELMGKIGQGAFASVWKARTVQRNQQQEQQEQQQLDDDKPADGDQATSSVTFTSHECAVKILNLDHVNSNLDEIRLEVQAMRLSSHPNVLACYAAFISDTLLWVVTPLMRKGSSIYCLETARQQLRQQQQQQNQQQQQQQQRHNVVAMEDHILYILHETLLGLQYIHQNGQIHRDIKASNILLDGTAEVKIADFGVSSFLIHSGWSQHTKAKTFVGTPCWMAPEVMEQVHGYDYKADIWSLGITALELAKGYAPYAKFPPMKVLILTMQEAPPTLDTYNKLAEQDGDSNAAERNNQSEEQFSTTFQELVQVCLQKNPTHRPHCQDLLKSKYFASFANSTYRNDRQTALQRDICSLVDDVGEDIVTGAGATASPPLTAKAGNVSHDHVMLLHQIQLTQQEQLHCDRPAGTTWIFPEGDGEELAATTPASQAQALQEVEDVLEELDQFGRQIGGEHYYTARQEQQEADEKQQQADDIDQFLNEFEQSTAGEDFRRPP